MWLFFILFVWYCTYDNYWVYIQFSFRVCVWFDLVSTLDELCELI